MFVCVCLPSQDEDMPTAHAPCALVTAHPVAERLDSLMVVLMAYVKDVCYLNGSLRTQLLAGLSICLSVSLSVFICLYVYYAHF